MKTNIKKLYFPASTSEGAKAATINLEQQLRRSVMACMLFESEFYESGQSIAERIAMLVPQCRPDFVAACAYHARTDMKLRHAPLLLIREMARLPTHKHLVGALLRDCIQRPDEINEFLALYWKGDAGKVMPNGQVKHAPLSAQVKKGLAAAFQKFDEYSVAKWNKDGQVKLRDALFLSHSRPADVTHGVKFTKLERKNAENFELTHGERLYKRLVDDELVTPDTWEVALSGGADKKEAFTRLMAEKKLGALAFLRNLRNMTEAGIDSKIIAGYAANLDVERVLPFRFIAAARAVPQLEPILEPLMLKCLEGQDKIGGRTVLMIDVSGSMDSAISVKSDLRRLDAACGLAILLREICDDPIILTFSQQLVGVPPRHGFALRDAIVSSQEHGGTYLANAINALHANDHNKYDRLIIITDEQSHDGIAPPHGDGYVINVASAKNGIGYGAWNHIDGWSESVVDYIREFEKD